MFVESIRRLPLPAVFFAIAAGVFLIAKRASYKGDCMDDDWNTLSWARNGDVSTFLSWLVSPRFHPENFRPVGAFYYRIFGGRFGLRYPPYVAGVDVIHICNGVW